MPQAIPLLKFWIAATAGLLSQSVEKGRMYLSSCPYCVTISFSIIPRGRGLQQSFNPSVHWYRWNFKTLWNKFKCCKSFIGKIFFSKSKLLNSPDHPSLHVWVPMDHWFQYSSLDYLCSIYNSNLRNHNQLHYNCILDWHEQDDSKKNKAIIEKYKIKLGWVPTLTVIKFKSDWYLSLVCSLTMDI